jgi:hypothetical protein
MPTLPAIHPKIAGGAVGGYLAVIVLYLLSHYAGFNPPVEVSTAIAGLIILIAGGLSPNPGSVSTAVLMGTALPPEPAPAGVVEPVQYWTYVGDVAPIGGAMGSAGAATAPPSIVSG